jgi:NTE family protein
MTPKGQKADVVFEGGGVKGIGLVGALQAFEEAGFHWQNVAGTSAGAITAALVAAGYTAQETRAIMNDRLDFHKFMDTSGIGKLPVLGPWLSLISSKGMYKGDYFLKWMRQMLSEKIGKDIVTFGDLPLAKESGDSDEDYEKRYKYRLRVVVSDISGNELLVLPQDIRRLGGDPDKLEVALAVRMSMSIPFFFGPVVYGQGEHEKQKHWIMDGGMLSNFPIWLFDSPADKTPEWPTIGFLLWEPGSDKHRAQRIRGLISMGLAMVRTMTSAHDRKALDDADLDRIVKIPTGRYSTTDFDLTRQDQDWLYNSGYQAAKAFLQGWSFSQYQAEQTPRGPRQA